MLLTINTKGFTRLQICNLRYMTLAAGHFGNGEEYPFGEVAQTDEWKEECRLRTLRAFQWKALQDHTSSAIGYVKEDSIMRRYVPPKLHAMFINIDNAVYSILPKDSGAYLTWHSAYALPVELERQTKIFDKETWAGWLCARILGELFRGPTGPNALGLGHDYDMPQYAINEVAAWFPHRPWIEFVKWCFDWVERQR
jgi:hypothetical protein